MARDTELEQLRAKTREAMRRLRDSVDLEDYDADKDPDSTVKIHAVGRTVVVNSGSNNSSAINEPPSAPEPTGVTVLKLLPVWGRVFIVTFLIGTSVWTGHSLGWW
jgi:hypothetical protein